MKTFVILLAGGRGARMNASVNKVLMPLCGKPVIRRSAEAFIPFADEMVVVCRPEDHDAVSETVGAAGLPFPVRFVPGGETRQASVLNGLKALSADPDDAVLIHDGARCLADGELISRVIRSVRECGTGIPGIPATSTCKICGPDAYVLDTPDRSALYEIQTPQGFTAGKIIPAALKAEEDGFEGTDDAGLLEHLGIPVKVVPGASSNIKLTEPDDMYKARVLLKGDVPDMRIGMGYDVHRLVAGRKLVLCGVEIPFELGLLGHSDADVALHALMDAMLGACALGDIGKHFPDTDEKYKGISSLLLLKETAALISEAGYRVANADVTIVAQKPKILPWIPQMIENVSSAVGIPADRVNIKATTTEKLGFEGRMEGISSYAVCSVVQSGD